MSPIKRTTSVTGPRRAVEPPPAVPTAANEPKARVTLNLSAPMYRDIEHWAIEAAGMLGVHRVSVQNALRAMIGACLTDPTAKDSAIAMLRHERN